MKELKGTVEILADYKCAEKSNHENFPAWDQSMKASLDQLAMCGTLGNSFYASGTALTKDALKVLERSPAEELAKAVVKGRSEGFIRTFPILGLVFLSQKDPALFKKAFPQVVLTGNDLADFMDLARSFRGFGRAMKSAIHSFLKERVTPYYAMKYRRPLADAIRLSRFKGEDPIYSYILSVYPQTKGYSQEKLDSACAQYKVLADQKKFLELLRENRKSEAASLLRESDMDVDALTAFYDQFDKAIWQAAAERTPVMKFLKFLAKFQREKVRLADLTREKITVSNLRKAKVFPFRLVTAALSLREEKEDAFDNVKEILLGVLDDYTDSYDWKSFNEFKWVIAPDVSGSMRSPVGGSSVLTFAHLSAMFTAFFRRGLDHVEILPWDTEVHAFDVPKNDSVRTQINAMLHMVGGGTHMEVAVEHMIRHRIMADYAVFLTDIEEYGKGWLKSWKAYRKINPKAKAFLLRGDSYLSAPISEKDAEKYGIVQIFGWNDSVMDYIHYRITEKGKKDD
ncbi:MAG: hypothetical protein J6A21_08055 [Lentisphaeria bacterium]|nr:hypothetical protein [Lentisphaeria bacterium]